MSLVAVSKDHCVADFSTHFAVRAHCRISADLGGHVEYGIFSQREWSAHHRAFLYLRIFSKVDRPRRRVENGGLDKSTFLKAFEPDFYFDDQRGHIDSARAHVAAGHVPFGIANLR